MANASVEKLKALGLRHGEKAVVGLAAAACVVCFAMAANKPSFDLTPQQVTQDATTAQSNLERKIATEDLLKQLEEAGIKNPHFEQMVDERTKNALVAATFRPAHPYVYNEPGAGLIRDMPELIAPTRLAAYPGRGAALVYELDENGARIPDTSAAEEVATSGMGGGRRPARKRGPSAAELRKEEEAKKEAERELAKKKALLAGGEAATSETGAETPAVAEGPMKEITKGLRWVTITGVIEYAKLRESYLAALKATEVAYPHFKQLDVERQTRQPDGSWAEWEAVDVDRNATVLNNLPEEEEELTPATARIDALVDPLPFLKAGYWERVHVASLVPRELIEAPPVPAAGMPGAGMPGAPYPGERSSTMNPPQMQRPSTMNPPQMGGYASAGAAGGEDTSFQHTESDTIMIRSLDFTTEPEKTYRFRARIVVFNPNKDREDVSPGVDTKSVELNGPWSEPTNEVTMPADVTAYALRKEPTIPNREIDPVRFQVTRWNPQDGVTVVRDWVAKPGQIVGDVGSVPVPVSDGSGKKSLKIDFNSHEIVLDAAGGERMVTPAVGAGRFEIPATALLVRPDGTVAVRNQALDLHDEVRKDIETNYRRELDESSKKRESSSGMMRANYPGGPSPGQR